MNPHQPPVEVNQGNNAKEDDKEIQQLLPLFRLLVREPPNGHDFDTCPVCKRHGITNLEA